MEKVLSGEKVKRPAPGGEGYTIDTYSRAAFGAFFDAFDKRIADIPNGAVRAWFHDSFEYTGNWSGAMLEEFQRRRGYDLRRRLPELQGEGEPDRVGRVLSDYRETLSDLLRENVVAPLSEWARARGGLSRNQAHGSPGNLLDLYAACDIPETEIFGRLGGSDSDPLISKFASSAAHVTGKPLTSAESFTWLNEHFTVTLEEIKRAADQLLVSGVNHIVFHGTAYSPPDAAWPGWVFYASTQLNSRNPIWRDLPVVNRYITRAQSVLQSGLPSNEVLLYWPYYDVLDNPGPMFQQLAVHSPVWFYQESTGPVAAELWRQGYSFDYVSDRQLSGEVARRYRAIVVPQTRRMPAQTFERLMGLAREGATVVFQKHLPEDVPGLGGVELRRERLRKAKDALRFAPGRMGIPEARLGMGRVLLANAVDRALEAAGVARETFAADGIQFIRRAHEGGYSYFLVNGGAAFDGWLPVSAPMKGAVLMDPMTGAAGVAEVRQGRVRLQLDPGESMIVRTYTSVAAEGAAWRYLAPAPVPRPLEGTWKVKFLEGGPELPASYEISRLDSWTLQGEAAASFAGTASYTLAFPDPGLGKEYLLDLGDVRDSARVRLNGREVGTAVMGPYRLRVGGLLNQNVLEVRVTNVAANRIRDMDHRKVPWRIFHDINFVNIQYRPFDASGWAVRAAGLIGPVHLIPLQ